jgi:putative transposase
MLKAKSRASKRQRRSREQWQALLARFESAGLSVAAFCAGELISEASFYRWRGLFASSGAGHELAPAAAFVDLGAMASGVREARLELRLDLGGGVVLHLVRG